MTTRPIQLPKQSVSGLHEALAIMAVDPTRYGRVLDLIGATRCLSGIDKEGLGVFLIRL
jgi:hypothetical protein